MRRYAILRLVEPSRTIAWREFVVVLRRRPMRWLPLIKTLPLLRLCRLRKQGRTKRPKLALRLVLAEAGNEITLAFEFVVSINEIKFNYSVCVKYTNTY